jgi:threonine dehydratase
MMASLTEEEKKKGVITCSAGNHAQGVALSAKALGIKATVLMPVSTPSIKVNNVKRLGGDAVLHGVDFDGAKAECLRRAEAEGLTFIPPYDDPYVVAGQGTIAMEICRQMADPNSLDGVFSAVGGGGLTAGIAAYMKRVAGPGIKCYGVETVDGDAMARSLKAGRRVLLDEVGPFADGTAVRIVGEECFRVCQELVDDVVIVNNDEICAAIKDVFEGELSECKDSHLTLRNPLDPRAVWCPRSCRSQGLHQQARPQGLWKEVCRRRVWWQHELWPSSFRR